MGLWWAALLAVVSLGPTVMDAVLVLRLSDDEFSGLVVVVPVLYAIGAAAVGVVIGIVLRWLDWRRSVLLAVAAALVSASGAITVWMPLAVAGDCHESMTHPWPRDVQLAFTSTGQKRVSRLDWERRFDINRTGADDEVFVYSPSLASSSRVTYDACTDESPVLSPDGDHLAYISWTSGDSWQIYVLARAGGRPRPLEGSRRARCPRWAPDSRRLLVVGRQGAIQLIGPAGTISLTPAPENLGSPECPTWASDGARIYLDGDGQLRTYDSRTGRLLRQQAVHYPAGTGDVEVAPDGRHLAYVVDNLAAHDLYVASTNGGQTRLLATLGDGSDNREVSWSSNSRQVAVLVGDESSPRGMRPALIAVATGSIQLINASRSTGQPIAR